MLATLAATLAVIAALGVYALSLMTGLNDRTRLIATENIPELVASSNTRAALNEYRQLQLRQVLERSPAAISHIAAELAETRRAIQDGLEEYRRIAPEQDERETAVRLLLTWRRYLQQSEPALALSRRNGDGQAGAILSGRASATFETLRHDLQEVQVDEMDEADATFATEQRAFASARTAFAIALLTSIVVIGGLGLWLLVIGPLRRSGASESYRRRF